ncbi:hypothetical protein BDR26DRAFT_928116 [Obelidium mucronatum]|nr:hypothetical protein BDR26DRAFT_928116 [Obelidium mucronatum]
MSRLQSLSYSRAVLQHGVELLVLCAGASVSSVKWLETETPNKTVNVDCDGNVAGNAAVFIDKADFDQQNRRECALLSLYRLTDAVSRLQDVNNPSSSRTSKGSLDYLEGYRLAVPPATLDLAAIKEYSKSVGCNDVYHSALLALEDTLARIDRIVLASFETVKQAKFFDVISDHNSNFEANLKALSNSPELNLSVPNIPVVVTAAFAGNMKGFSSLAWFAEAIVRKTPDLFLCDTDSRFRVLEFFRSSRDSRPEFTLDIYDRTTPVKDWMQRKIEMGATFEFFNFDLNWNGNDPADTVGASVVVRFGEKITLRGVVSVEMINSLPLRLVFLFTIAECSPADFGWEHVYPAGYWGLRIEE